MLSLFKQWIATFILSEYSLDPQVRYKNQISLEYNLLLFSHFNPNFGKKLRKRRFSINDIMEFVFNDTAIDMSNVAVYISRPINVVNSNSDEENNDYEDQEDEDVEVEEDEEDEEHPNDYLLD